MNFKTIPYAHQLEAYNLSCNRAEYALFMEMGTGKSKVLIDTVAHLYSIRCIDSALIVAPKGTYLTWLFNEIPRHMPDGIKWKAAFWSSSLRYDDKQALKQLMLPVANKELYILIVNTEAMSTATAPELVRKFLENNTALLCIDESTSIKSHQARRTKTLVKLGRLAHYRRIMTGTPITNNPLDLYTQCQFLNPELLGYTSFTAFRSHYAKVVPMKMGLRMFNKIVGFKNLDDLQARIQPFSYRKLKTECLDLPEKIYSIRYVELTPEQKRVYEELRQKSLAELRRGTVTVPNVLTKLMRLHQVVCGHTKLDDGTIVQLENNRLDVLLETVEEATGKVIIWAVYQQDVEAISDALCAHYGYASVVRYYGKTSDEEREIGLKAFTDPESEAKFFVGSPQTGGKGLTLVTASTVIYYSNSYNLENRLQSEDRAHRIGQTKNVNYVDFVSPCTVDEKIVAALRAKKQLADMVLDSGREIETLLEPVSDLSKGTGLCPDYSDGADPSRVR